MTYASTGAARLYRHLYIDDAFWRPRNLENERILRRLVEALPKPLQWVDLFCGQGWHFDFSGPGVSATGVDASGPQLELARARNPDATFVEGEVLDVLQSEALQLPIGLATIFWGAYGYLGSVHAIDSLLRSLANRMTRGNVLYLEVLDPSTLLEFNTSSFAAEQACRVEQLDEESWTWKYRDPLGPHVLCTPPLGDMIELLTKAGFRPNVASTVQTLHQVLAVRG